MRIRTVGCGHKQQPDTQEHCFLPFLLVRKANVKNLRLSIVVLGREVTSTSQHSL